MKIFICALICILYFFAPIIAEANVVCANTFANSPLEIMLEKAEAAFAEGRKDNDLAQELLKAANDDLVASSLEAHQARAHHVRAFELVRELKIQEQKSWQFKIYRSKEPVIVDLGPFLDQGITNVKAIISFQDLVLGTSVRERLMGITFQMTIDRADQRAVDLPAISESVVMKWGSPNDGAKLQRRHRVINRHKKLFNGLLNEHTRLGHYVRSLARGRGANAAQFLLPDTQINSSQFLASRRPDLSPELLLALQDAALKVIRGEIGVRVNTGYQNGNTRNKWQ